VLGAVLLLPYAMLTGLLARTIATSGDNLGGALATTAVAAVVAVTPPFLGGTRELEIAATRALLGVDLPPRDRAVRLAGETRLRAALWFALHLGSGAAVGVGVLIAVPLALLAFTERLGITRGALTGIDLGPIGDHDLWAWTLIGIALLLGTVYATAGLGAVAATMAPVLLGPSPAERVAAVEARERRLAERNRLARELHDSVGHALTAATLQAGAARSVFDRDPEFARQALATIEELGRTALDELDTVLGVLRDGAAPHRASPTLAELDRLLTPEVTASVATVQVPAVVSREAYRIVQEGLTNAAKHGAGRTELSIDEDGEELVVTMTNERGPISRTGGGRGLAGMRERVRLLGGELTAGPDGDRWRVVARLPRHPGRPR
jgi:signal transduction histidine kinase